MSLVTTSMHDELQSDIFIFGYVAASTVGDIEDVIFFYIWDNPRQIDQKSRNDNPYLKCQVKLLAYRAIIVGIIPPVIFSVLNVGMFFSNRPRQISDFAQNCNFRRKKSSL